MNKLAEQRRGDCCITRGVDSGEKTLDTTITESRRRQVFLECLFWVVFNSVEFYLSRQLTQENYGIVKSKEKRELCMHVLDSATDYIKIKRRV